jgi:hypothetical protein
VGRTLVANRLLAGSACGKRRRGRPLNSVVRLLMGNVRVALSPEYEWTCEKFSESRSGEVFHIVRNSSGGSVSTPIARFAAFYPKFAEEGFHRHWRLDCYVRRHKLAPKPEWLGERLAESLLERHVVEEPLWVSWHMSEELKGKAYGVVFSDE